ncbi:hypothetical protein NKF26_03300 [Haladaptatus sp. AB618]|uniref:hypothetical protein n=1 Tax=Haladaptatus sp. AB618 TaxID=2934173 RepID=UPI00209C3B1B|nr:hypothetical protein [Haladaptatus sp. AB618]MCO8252829.1 hypothetical protein [Haladaptatus sp. AB618]
MALKKSLLSGLIAFIVATVAARLVGGKELETRIGLLTGVSVALSTWVSSRQSGKETELADEATAV